MNSCSFVHKLVLWICLKLPTLLLEIPTDLHNIKMCESHEYVSPMSPTCVKSVKILSHKWKIVYGIMHTNCYNQYLSHSHT